MQSEGEKMEGLNCKGEVRRGVKVKGGSEKGKGAGRGGVDGSRKFKAAPT